MASSVFSVLMLMSVISACCRHVRTDAVLADLVAPKRGQQAPRGHAPDLDQVVVAARHHARAGPVKQAAVRRLAVPEDMQHLPNITWQLLQCLRTGCMLRMEAPDMQLVSVERGAIEDGRRRCWAASARTAAGKRRGTEWCMEPRLRGAGATADWRRVPGEQ